jgi:hypothetical protein
VAREAFVHGMQLTAGIASVLAVGLAVLAFTALRHVQPADHAQATEEVTEGTTEDAGDAVVVNLTDALADCAANPENCAAA